MAEDLDDLLDEVERNMIGMTPLSDKRNGRSSIPNSTNNNSATIQHHSASFSTSPSHSRYHPPSHLKGAMSLDGNKSFSRHEKHGIDRDIDEILSEDVPASKFTSSSTSVERVSNSASKKCFPIYVNGSEDKDKSKACGNLRCTDCDFKVLYFDSRAWHADTDYLFLRNNMPMREKLQAKLKTVKGSRAYCCQCKYLSVSNLTEIRRHYPDVHWSCGKH